MCEIVPTYGQCEPPAISTKYLRSSAAAWNRAVAVAAVNPIDPGPDDRPGDGHNGHVGHTGRVQPDRQDSIAHQPNTPAVG